jgi:hypothetical protein
MRKDSYRRFEKVQPEDDGKTIHIPLHIYLKDGEKIAKGEVPERKADQSNAVFRSNLAKGPLTIWRPEHVRKKVAFEADNFDELYKDTIIEKNEYLDPTDRLLADVAADLPSYTEVYKNRINVTKERIELLRI